MNALPKRRSFFDLDGLTHAGGEKRDVVIRFMDLGHKIARMTGAREQSAHYRRLPRESGWFDDPPNGVDFYNTWAISYELFWINQLAPHFDRDFITSAVASSGRLTEHLISPRGIPIMGRSICYRTAVSVPVLAAQLVNPANEPAHARRALDVV